MKKILLLCALIWAGLWTCQAQQPGTFSLNGSFALTKAVQSGAMFTQVQAAPSYQTGISLGYRLSNKFELMAGLRYARRGFGQDIMDDRFMVAVIDPATGEESFLPDPSGMDCPLPNAPGQSNMLGFRHQLRSWEVPIAARYYITRQDKLSLYAIGGVTAHHTIAYTPATVFQEPVIDLGDTGDGFGKTDPTSSVVDEVTMRMEDVRMRQNDVSLQLGFGVTYELCPKMGIYLQPATDWWAFGSEEDTPLARDWKADMKLEAGISLHL